MGTVFLFSGQGAQFSGMGRDIVENSQRAAAIFAEADKVLGWQVSTLCFEGPDEKLTESRYCQPAIYTTSIACLEAFKEKYPDITPVGCAGLSLGEYAALYCAGSFSFADGLKLIAKRGELMDEACRSTVGAMASVLGGDIAIIREVCEQEDVDVANLNCPGQVVISGEKNKIQNAVAALKERGLRKVIPLKVAGAYHSRLMKQAGDKLGQILNDTAIAKPVVAITQNFTGEFSETPEEIRKNLEYQVAGSVLWELCVRKLIDKGADTFMEFGPGNVLTGLVKRIDKSKRLINISTFENITDFSREK